MAAVADPLQADSLAQARQAQVYLEERVRTPHWPLLAFYQNLDIVFPLFH